MDPLFIFKSAFLKSLIPYVSFYTHTLTEEESRDSARKKEQVSQIETIVYGNTRYELEPIVIVYIC